MWKMKLKGVPRAVNYKAVSINSNIYSFNISRAQKDFIDVYIFHPESYRWELVETQSLPGGRPTMFLASSVVAYGDCAYVCNRWIPENPDSDCNLYLFDTNTIAWSCPEVCGDEPRSSSRAARVVGQRMCIITDQQVGSLQHIHFLGLDNYKWHRVDTRGDAPINPPLNSVCAIRSRIYVWGGSANDKSVFYLDTVTSTWVHPHVEGVAPECRFSHIVFVYKGEMYIFCGYNRQQCILFVDLHKYNPGKSCWTRVRPKRSGPCARVLHACCVIGDRAVVFHGRRSKPTGGDQSDRADRELVSPNRVA